MSKSTKIIAALGVVAGLGVAALPAFTYAADPVSTTGNVEVDVEVLPAIAMTISGNNDNGEHYNPTTAQYVYTAVTPSGAENPSEEGWYERSGSDPDYTYTLTDDEEVEAGTTYYIRTSSVFNPVDNSAPTGVLAVDGHPAATIAGTSSSYASLLPNAVVEGDGTNGFRSTITVYTNNTSGYTLSVIDSDATTNLTHTNGTDFIPTGAEAVAAGTAKWNFDTIVLSGGTVTALTAAAMPASGGTATPIDGLSTKTTNGRVTVVDYNVATSADQATGVYSDTIIYTATTN